MSKSHIENLSNYDADDAAWVVYWSLLKRRIFRVGLTLGKFSFILFVSARMLRFDIVVVKTLHGCSSYGEGDAISAKLLRKLWRKNRTLRLGILYQPSFLSGLRICV